MKTIHVGDVVGDYAVIGIAGSGGMGTVYKIEHLITRRVEAMKLLPAGLSVDPEQVHRFEREIQVQARLHHPNIVALYNAVRDGDSIALVMEFVEGDSLQRVVAAGPLPVETAVAFATQVLRALAYAHEAGVIHRDVSPANIIITPALVAKLTDFGLALGATDLRLSTTGVALGSPWYMSPEQVKGIEKLDARTDLYAMGAVLHEMLTGRKLFEAEGTFAVMRAHVEAVPHPPSTINPRVPPELDAIVSRAVAKDPAMRFQSAEEFRLALQRGALESGAEPKPSRPRKTWLAGLPGMLPSMPSGLPGIHASRTAILMLLVPTVLAAGFFAVRSFTTPARGQFPEGNSGLAPISRQDAAQPSPVVTAPPAPEPPAVAAATPAVVPAAIEAPIATALPRAKSPAKAVRPVQTEQSTALRITGSDSTSAAPVTSARRESAQAVETPEPAAPKTTSAEAPEPTPPAPAPTPVQPLPPPQVAPPASPQNGNRLVRALGKVNLFRRLKKNDPAKDPTKQD